MTPSAVITLAKLSSVAYQPNPSSVDLELIERGLFFHTQLFDAKTNASGFIAINESINRIYLIFKGTKQPKDFLIDSEIIQVDEQPQPWLPTVGVHQGFYRSIKSLLAQIDDFIWAEYPNYDVYISGHSLGGALATLACVFHDFHHRPIYLCTFGSPRVGDKHFANLYNTAVEESVRIVHDDDLVPMIPWGIVPPLEYHHIKTELHLADDGKTIGKFNLWRHFWYWIKGKSKLDLVSLSAHDDSKYISTVLKWSSTQ